MGEYHEAFVAFDVAKMKHAVAVAEGGRSGEVRFLDEIENKPTAIERNRPVMAAPVLDQVPRTMVKTCVTAAMLMRPERLAARLASSSRGAVRRGG
jgi:hypothetical protein